MVRWAMCVTRKDKIKNEYVRGTAKIAKPGDKLRGTRLRWYNSTQLLFTMTLYSAGGKQRKTNWSSKSAAPECNNLRHDVKTH